jgi:ferredoxin
MITITDDCMRCGACQEYCPKGAIVMARGKIEIDHELCIACGACLSVECPGDAIKREVAG